MQVVMDFHAHLNMNEVIGLLAGFCDEEQRLIRYAYNRPSALGQPFVHQVVSYSQLYPTFSL